MPFTPQELEEIKRQQMAAAGGVDVGAVPPAPPPPDPYYSPQPQPFPGATGARVMSLPPRVQQQQANEAARLALAQKGDAREQGKFEEDKAAALDDPTTTFYAHQVLAGGAMPSLGMGAAKAKQLIMKKVAQIAGQMGVGGADLATQQAHYKAVSGRLGVLEKARGTIGQNEQTALLNGQQFMDRSAEMPLQTQSPALNAVTQFGQKQLPIPGHETKAAMDAAWLTFVTEYAKVVQGTPSGAGVLSDSARHEAMDTIQNSLSMTQKQSAFKQLKTDMANRIKALDNGLAESYSDLTKLPKLESSLGASDAETPEEKVLGTTIKTVDVPKGYQDAHSAFLQMHPKGSLTADAYRQLRQSLDKQFLPPNEASHLSDEEVNAFVDKYNKGAEAGKIPGIDVPLSAEEKDNNARAATPGGTMLLKTADALTAGIPDLLIGQEGRDKMAMLDEKNPNAALAGDVLGSLAPMAGIEKLGVKGVEQLARFDKIKALLSPSARKRFLGDVAVNATYGGARGFNAADEGQGAEGALEGAAGGAVAAGAGNLVTQGVKPILSDATSKALAQLKGVDTTTFQKLGLGKVEKILTNLPGVHGARSNAEVDFNRNNSNRVLQRIGETLPHDVETGLDANAYVNKRLNTSYNEIKPLIKGSEDGTFVKNVDVLKASSSTGRDYKKVWGEIQDAINLFKDENGHYTGEGYLAASEKLRELSKDLNKGTYSQNIPSTVQRTMARVADQTKTQMQQLIQRETPEVGVRLKALERAWKHQSVIEDATNKSLKNNGIYSPGDLLDSTRMAETNRKLAARGKAFDQGYASAGQKIMGSSKVGDIAPDRMFYTGLGVTGAGVGAHAVGATAIAPASVAIAAAAYLPGVKRITQAVLSGKRISVADRAIVERAANGEFGEGFQKLGTAIKNGATEKIIRRSLEDATRHKMTGN